MTMYQAIEKMLRNFNLTEDMAWKIIFEAYSNNCIDGYELDELCNIYENRNVA